jgi:recombination DNA repair RAD52 pathway protein
MSDQSKELALVSKDDLSLVGGNALNEKQLQLLLKRTPSAYVKQRPAKGGGTWSYVTGGYVRKVLNLMFGFKWNFEIVDEQIFPTEVVVKGKLTVETDSGLIVKMQYGNKDVMCKRGTDIPLSIGNDLKAACTDALKKCAAELGIAADIYNAEDFREVKIAEAQTNYDNIVDDAE